jgi:hypothetical protein
MAYDLRLIPKDNGCGCGVCNPIGLWIMILTILWWIFGISHLWWVGLFTFPIGFMFWDVI